jgi:hypothetical protein
MVRKNFLAFIVCLQSGILFCAQISVTAPETNYYKEVKAVLNNYKRPITVLEIGSKSSCYTLPIATDSKYAKCIALFEGDATPLAQIAHKNRLKNVVILNPQALALDDLKALGRCEHFDVVLVHGVDSLLKDFSKALNLLSHLGDFLFLEIPKDAQHDTPTSFNRVASSETHQLYLSHKPKTTLDIARFNEAATSPGKNPPYLIKSDFKEKWLYKQQSKSAWIPGINIVTFVMLHGIYPSDTAIISQFQKMKRSTISHNDLLIGNMVMQGTSLVPIDFDGKDGRRKNMMHVCLNVAIKLFKDTSRFRNPRGWLDRYIKTIKEEVKRERAKNKTNV